MAVVFPAHFVLPFQSGGRRPWRAPAPAGAARKEEPHEVARIAS
jgi:hypothetical protein